MVKKRRIVGAAAGCAVLLATVLGPAGAGANGSLECGKVDGPCLPLEVGSGRPTDIFFKVDIDGMTQGLFNADTDLGTRVPFLGEK